MPILVAWTPTEAITTERRVNTITTESQQPNHQQRKKHIGSVQQVRPTTKAVDTIELAKGMLVIPPVGTTARFVEETLNPKLAELNSQYILLHCPEIK